MRKAFLAAVLAFAVLGFAFLPTAEAWWPGRFFDRGYYPAYYYPGPYVGGYYPGYYSSYYNPGYYSSYYYPSYYSSYYYPGYVPYLP